MKQLFRGKIFRAGLLISIILVSSAVFLSQADRLYGKAQTTAITGTMVLTDHLLNTQNFIMDVYLPGSNCEATVNYCYTDGSTTNSYCRQSTGVVTNLGGNKYRINLQYRQLGSTSQSCPQYCSCTKISGYTQTGTTVSYSCSGGNGWYGSSAVTYCGPDNICGNGDDVSLCTGTGSGDTAYPAGSKFNISCSMVYTNENTGASVVDKAGLPQPATHVSVSYRCT